MSIEIGAIKAIVGKFWIHTPNGESHLAVVGEMLHVGDRIVGSSANTSNSVFSLDLVGNIDKDIALGANDVLILDQAFMVNVLGMEDTGVNKASLVAAWEGPSEELSIKIEDNKDVLAVADTEIEDGETAAGGAASDGQITPAYFADRTGAFGDVRTALSLTTPDAIASDSIAPLTSPIVLETELVNNPPVFVDFREGPGEPIEGYSFNYSENSVAGVIIGTVHATDLDGDNVTYSITAGNNDGYFEIDPDTGALTLTAAGAAAYTNDFETLANAHNLTVGASDGTNMTTIGVTLGELNVNEAPVFVDGEDTPVGENGYSFTYNENSAAGTVIGTVIASDVDAGTTLVYSITAGNNDGYFEIDPDTGALTLTAAGAAAYTNDFETLANAHNLTVGASDGTNTTTIGVTLGELNVNEAPIAVDDYGITDLRGEYYGYAQGRDGPNLLHLDQLRTFISNNTPDATFTPTTINYGYGSGDLGKGHHLQEFLKGDATTLSNDPGNTSDAIIHMSGYITMDAGTYNFKVRADDGYTILIDGQDVATVDKIQSPTGTVHSQFTVEAGVHQIEFLYWDQGGEYQFKVELREGDGAYQVINVSGDVVSALTTVEDTPLVIDAATLLVNDTDVDTTDVLSIVSVQSAVNGSVVLDIETQKVTFTPTTNNGTGSFTYTISDGHGGTSTATVHLNIIDGIPTAVADTAMATESYTVHTPAVHTLTTVTIPESWVSTIITDKGTGNSHNGWQNISSPGIASTNVSIKADSTHHTTVSFTMGDTNRNGTATLYEKVDGPDHVISSTSFTGNSDNQTISFGNAITHSGIYYVLFNRVGGSGSNVDIDKVEYHSYAYTPAITTIEDIVTPAFDTVTAATAAIGNVLDNDVLGMDGGSVTSITGSGAAAAVSDATGVDVAGTHGTLHIDTTGAYMYTPASDDMASGAYDTFHYTITDADGSISTSTLTIDIANTVVYNATSTAMEGAAGYDVLVFPTDGTEINFANLGNVIHNIEAIDLGHGATADNHALTNLSVQDVVAMTDSDNTLIIKGDALDSVSVLDTGTATWSKVAGAGADAGFDIYQNSDDPTVTLKIETTIDDTIVH